MDIYITGQLNKTTAYSALQRKFFCLFHMKFKRVAASRDEKQPLEGILRTACSYYTIFLWKYKQIPSAFHESVWTCESFQLFPREVSLQKPLPKSVNCQLWLTALYLPLRDRQQAFKFLSNDLLILTHSKLMTFKILILIS